LEDIPKSFFRLSFHIKSKLKDINTDPGKHTSLKSEIVNSNCKNIWLNRFKPRSEFTRNVFTLLTGTTVAQVIPIAISPILTRIYLPEDFGMFALYIAISGVFAVGSMGRYEMAIILPKENSTAINLMLLTMTILICFVAAGFLFSSVGYFIYDYKPIYLTIPLMVSFIGMNNVLDKYNNRIKNYKMMSYQRLTKTSVESIVSIFSGFILSLKQGLIYGSILGFLSSFLLMLSKNYSMLKEGIRESSKKDIGAAAHRYKNFPLYNMPHAVLNTFSADIPIFLIPIFFGNAKLGLYAFGLKIVQAPLRLISMSVHNVLSQKIAEMYSNKKDLRPIFWQTFKKLSWVVIIAIPFILFADKIFALVFGKEWIEAGEYIQLLSIWILMTFIVSCFASIPYVFDRQRKALILEIIYSLARILPYVIGAYFFKFSIKEVFIFYTVLATLLLLYSFYWYYSLIRNPQ
jgi:O-antigen/teichoic acid export membrane protein